MGKTREKSSSWNSNKGLKPTVTEAFRLAKSSCAEGDGYGCGVGFILKDYGKYTDEKPSNNVRAQAAATGFSTKEQDNAIEGWSYESVEAGGVCWI